MNFNILIRTILFFMLIILGVFFIFRMITYLDVNVINRGSLTITDLKIEQK